MDIDWKIVFWTLIAFISGALPMSLWLGRLALQVDIRDYGDGNPGAFNVWRAGGKWWGLLAILLDSLKGMIPVAIAHFSVGIEGYGLTAVAFAPVLGHAFSPFLGFRGGKALAVTFGVWTGITIWFAPTVLGIAFAFWLYLLVVEGWAVMLGLLTLLAALLLAGSEPALLWLWLLIFIVVMGKHTGDLRRSPFTRRQQSKPGSSTGQ